MSNTQVEFRFYEMPSGDYVLPKIGPGWELEYGADQPKGMLHFHNFLEIGYCYHGSGELIIQDRHYRYGDDMFTIIPKNIPHTTISDPGHKCKWEYLFVNLDDFVHNEMKGIPLDSTDILNVISRRGTMKTRKNHPELAYIIRAMIEECRKQPRYYKESLKAFLAAFVIGAVRLDIERNEIRQDKKYTDYIEKAVRFIEEHYREDLKIAEIAGECGLSESHFRRVFAESTNMKPVEYINMVRIDHAAELLVTTDDPIEKIAEMSGYHNTAGFIRNFKEMKGMTPLRWRKEQASGRQTLRHSHIRAKKGWEAGDFI